MAGSLDGSSMFNQDTAEAAGSLGNPGQMHPLRVDTKVPIWSNLCIHYGRNGILSCFYVFFPIGVTKIPCDLWYGRAPVVKDAVNYITGWPKKNIPALTPNRCRTFQLYCTCKPRNPEWETSVGDKWETSVNSAQRTQSGRQVWETSVNSCAPRHPEWEIRVGDKCETSVRQV